VAFSEIQSASFQSTLFLSLSLSLSLSLKAMSTRYSPRRSLPPQSIYVPSLLRTKRKMTEGSTSKKKMTKKAKRSKTSASSKRRSASTKKTSSAVRAGIRGTDTASFITYAATYGEDPAFAFYLPAGTSAADRNFIAGIVQHFGSIAAKRQPPAAHATTRTAVQGSGWRLQGNGTAAAPHETRVASGYQLGKMIAYMQADAAQIFRAPGPMVRMYARVENSQYFAIIA
jgi:hypothetical protein